ncbi:MAG: RNA polymerase sigma factor [Pseudomonadota bacterium]
MSNDAFISHADILAVLPRLRKFAYSLTGNLPDADDLLQNTVERALTRQPPQHDREALARWLFTVCRNLWIDEIRARKVRGAGDPAPPEAQDQPDDAQSNPLDTVAVRELDRAVQALGEEQRAVLLLVAVEGYDYREAAELLDIPVGTVMSRLSRARRRLAEQLGSGNKSSP